MEESSAPNLQHTSSGGLAGTHDLLQPAPSYVAPSTDSASNLLRRDLIAIACWRVDDIRFAFDSSFVQADVAEEVDYLRKLREVHKQAAPSTTGSQVTLYPPLSLFGHADPVGNDDYNKTLSGRRAAAIYALLTRKTDVWEHLYSNPFGGDNWGSRATAEMQRVLGPDAPQSRKALFLAYMDKICTPDFVLDPAEDFLAGTDGQGKGDYQGCGEFNPLLLFSQAEDADFSQKGNENKRNEANAPNRRVLGLLFRVGTKVVPSKWPCPRFSESTAGCKKRFWSDGEARRNTLLPGSRREFSQSRDTFACRFYQRMTTGSPCEKVLPLVEIRLYDRQGVFIPNAPYKLRLGPGFYQGTADEDGWVRVRGVSTSDRATIYWSTVETDSSGKALPPQYPFALELFLDIDSSTQAQRATEQLNNLGYPVQAGLEANTKAFQTDFGVQYGLEPTGVLDEQTANAIADAHDSLRDQMHTQSKGA
jgi:hypothetical protein